MVDSLRLLQIGDIHLPDWQSKKSDVDVKDKQFSTIITDDLAIDRLRNVLRRINELATGGEIDCAAIMGDLTSYGAIEYLEPATQIMDALFRSRDGHSIPVFGVPGNHDVEKSQAATLGDAGKFQAIRDAFKKHDWMAPPTDDCVSYALRSQSDKTLDAILINTSLGSWSTHALPGSLAKEFDNASLSKEALTPSGDLQKEVLPAGEGGEPNPATREDQLFMQMDTPYVSRRSIESFSDIVGGCDASTMLVVAHHNLLPQRIPRILPYGELLNGGYLRKLLHTTNKNILFLHGHIHEDPIEVISVPPVGISRHDERKIVSISAPAITHGFNEITLFFSDNGDVFLVRVTKYRPNDLNVVGNFSDQDSHYVPLVQNFNELITGDARRLWHIVKDERVINWHELLEKTNALKFDEDGLEAALLKLFCCGLVKISQLGRPRIKWRMECIE